VSQTAISGAYIPRGSSRFIGDPTRAPFRAWVECRQLNRNGFENQRLDAIPDRTSGMGSQRGGRGLQHGVSSPRLAWEARRRHTSCSVRIDPAWDINTLYLRYVEEERYVKPFLSSPRTPLPVSTPICIRSISSSRGRSCLVPGSLLAARPLTLR
jgi:hypothetical protein